MEVLEGYYSIKAIRVRFDSRSLGRAFWQGLYDLRYVLRSKTRRSHFGTQKVLRNCMRDMYPSCREKLTWSKLQKVRSCHDGAVIPTHPLNQVKAHQKQHLSTNNIFCSTRFHVYRSGVGISHFTACISWQGGSFMILEQPAGQDTRPSRTLNFVQQVLWQIYMFRVCQVV